MKGESIKALYQVAHGQPPCMICKEGVQGVLGYIGPDDDIFGEVVCVCFWHNNNNHCFPFFFSFISL